MDPQSKFFFFFLKLNRDRSVNLNPGVSGESRVLRTDSGSPGFSPKLPWASNLQAELSTIQQGLTLAVMRGIITYEN